MNNEIVIISDLWGGANPEWLTIFKNKLAAHFRLKYYDACELANVKKQPFKQDKLHRQFIDSGIDSAAENLLNFETSSKIYIGNSIGGVIAWKAGVLGLPMTKLVTISSTRLRYEVTAPNCKKYNFFGAEDKFKPTSAWCESIMNGTTYLVSGGHEIYREKDKIDFILKTAYLS